MIEAYKYIFTPVIFLNASLLIIWGFYLYFKDEIYSMRQKDGRMLKWPGEEVDKYIYTKHPAFQEEQKKKDKFVQAGIDNSLYPKYFVFIKATLLILASSLGLYFFVIKSVFSIGIALGYKLLAVLGIAAFFIPDLDLHIRKKNRIKTFEKNLSTLMNMFLVCLDAGITFKEAIFYVSKELQYSHPIIAYELDRVYNTSNLLLDQKVAYARLAYRVPSDSLKKMVIIVLQNINHGSSLRKALAHLADFAHRERLFVLEKDAHRMPGILTLFTVIFTLPLMFIVLFGPYMHNLENLFKI